MRPQVIQCVCNSPASCFLSAACSCSPLGTLGSQVSCSQVTGQCPCLSNVEERDCSACQPGFYNLQSGDGCDRSDTTHLHHCSSSSLLIFITTRLHHYSSSSLLIFITTHHRHSSSSSQHITDTLHHRHSSSSSQHITGTLHLHHNTSQTLFIFITTHHRHSSSSSQHITDTFHLHHNISQTLFITAPLHHYTSQTLFICERSDLWDYCYIFIVYYFYI